MARTDEHTRKFMRDVVGDKPPEHHASEALDPLRTARFAGKVITNPTAAIGKYLVAKATKELIKEQPEEFQKKSSLDAIGLYGFMNEHHGREWWDWEPETLWKTIEDDHISGATPTELKEAILALQVILNTNSPFENWHIFEKVGHAFNMNNVDFSILQPLELDEAALTVAIMNRIRPKQEYEPEVLTYIAVCARQSGMAYLPENMFPGVQKYLDELNFDQALRDSVKNLWDKKDSSRSMTDAEDIQITRLKEISDYLKSGGF